MGRSIFGWDYPPGCSSVPGDEPDPPCEVCGQKLNDCVCPECPVCREIGNPACYDGAIICSWCGIRPQICGTCSTEREEPVPIPAHGLVRSFAHVALLARAEADWAAEDAGIAMYEELTEKGY